MATEDKLDKEERIRLEALAQANFSTQGRVSPEQVLEIADLYAAYIKGAQIVRSSTSNPQ